MLNVLVSFLQVALRYFSQASENTQPRYVTAVGP